MRITNHQMIATMQGSMARNSEKLGELMQKLATNQRMLLPSDDPIAATRVLRVQREQSSLDQYEKNIDTLSSSLSTQEANLTSISDLMLNLRDRLVWAANGTNTAENLAALAQEMSSLEASVYNSINVRDGEGYYLFSGTLSNVAAVSYDAATETYSVTGNDKYRKTAIADGVEVESNVTAEAIFGTSMDFLNDLHSLIKTLSDPALNPNDPLVGQQIADMMDLVDTTQGALLGKVTELGGRQNTLTLLKDNHDKVSLVNQRIEGELTELDYAGATIELNNYQLALQASQKTYVKINELALFKLL